MPNLSNRNSIGRIGIAFIGLLIAVIATTFFLHQRWLSQALTDIEQQQRGQATALLAEHVRSKSNLIEAFATQVTTAMHVSSNATKRLVPLATEQQLKPAQRLAGDLTVQYWSTTDNGDHQNQAWFSTALAAAPNRCLWLHNVRQPGNVSCLYPVTQNRTTTGILEVALAWPGPDDDLMPNLIRRDLSSYLVVVDSRGQRWLQPEALSTLSDQQESPWSMIDRELNELIKTRDGEVIAGDHYSAETISAFVKRHPKYDRDAAEQWLLQAWQDPFDEMREHSHKDLRANRDPILKQPVRAMITDVSGTPWRIVRVDVRHSQPLLSRPLDRRLLAICIAIALLTLLCAFCAVHWLTLRPLSKVISRLNDKAISNDSVVLDERLGGEAGTIARLINRRHERLSELAFGRQSQDPELAADRPDARSNESRNTPAVLQQTMDWLRERSNSILASDADAVFIVDDQDRIDDMNEAAEQLTGLSHTNDRGRRFDAAVRLQDESGNDVTVLDYNGEAHPRQMIRTTIVSRNSSTPMGAVIRLRQRNRTDADAVELNKSAGRLSDAESADGADEETWVNRINRGLEEDLFHLTTQAIVPLNPESTSGEMHEVLIQLEDEDGFWAPPGAFMPIAERRGLTGPIDRWVVNQTLDWLSKHPDTLEKLELCSLNISTQSLLEKDFLNYVVEQLEESEVDPRKLSFEISEDAVEKNDQAIKEFVNTLKTMGCLSSLDVFTAGMASAQNLRDMPVDFVKVSGRLTRHIKDEQSDRIVVESLQKIAKLGGCSTIAEHIDDAALIPVLRELGLDYVQGFAIARPTPTIFQHSFTPETPDHTDYTDPMDPTEHST